MKGIILAGGSGTRLHPMTLVTSKQLLPIYDKPMIYYPLSTLMMAGIREILLISSPRDLPSFRDLLGDGKKWGLELSYQVQERPEGLSQALVLGEKFLNNSACCLILGDNLFFGHGLPELLKESASLRTGATVFGYKVHDPERYGVVHFDKNMKALAIEEKPQQPKSDYAVPGIYFYDAKASALARSLTPSARGEYEITDLNNLYLKEGKLSVQIMGRGMAWLDTGTPESLLEATQFIAVLEKRQGLKVGCPEEIAARSGYINREQFLMLSQELGKSAYGQYLKRVYHELA